MTWLALRLLRPYLAVAALVTAAAVATTLHAAGVVRAQLDRAGVPGCFDPNVCYPSGGALSAVLRMELVAAFVPPLLGLILGAGLFAREREEDTLSYVLTQSVSRQRWVLTRLGWALGCTALCAATVALTHRLIGARYTVLANDTYELLQMLHLNNVAFMMLLGVALTAVGGLLGLVTGRPLATVALTAAAWPFTLIGAYAGVTLLSVVILAFGEPPTEIVAGAPSSFEDDVSFMDPVGYPAGAVLALAVVALVLLTRRTGMRPARH